ncbi:class I SAM-dependent methyltransferase [Microbacterium sp. XT11]|uniref:class I SAM-dependent methyltransferase n=1 Tax=Microbacterium sp. XT11 TaxID=367477 RepID=UPI00082FEEFC|nr:class I SAM-dependent methyltransferase [Microbacterium sp. XT11]
MSERFDAEHWEDHWVQASSRAPLPAHPALAAELSTLTPGSALDAGSGEGAEAVWLARHGWAVTAVDISATAVARAVAAADASGVDWVQADLTRWEPDRQYDLVTTFYAHPTMGQDAFYHRISRWVAPGGTLLIVGHDHHAPGHHGAPAHPEGSVTAPERIRGVLDPPLWTIRTAGVRERDAGVHGGHRMVLRDVVVRAERTAPSA